MTIAAPSLLVARPLAGDAALDDVLRARLVGRIAKDNGLPVDLAERILGQALVFLRLCAAQPHGAFAPSCLVDVGWHTFMLYTRDYAQFCERIAGRFIHHNPADEPGVQYPRGGMARTVQALRERGLPVDDELWITATDQCSVPCDPRDPCFDYPDGKPQPEPEPK
jgi:hypothetical protein